jgi:hypothetical protein
MGVSQMTFLEDMYLAMVIFLLAGVVAVFIARKQGDHE